MSKTKLIPGWAGTIIGRALEIYAPRVAALISSQALSAALLALFMRVQAIVIAISDNDPQNGAQVEAIVRQFISEDAVPLADGVIDERIVRIPNERVRRGLSILAEPVVDTLRILSDNNPNNAVQAEAVLDDFILKPTTQEFILSDLTVPVLERVIQDDFLRSFILEAMEQGLQQGLEELAEIEVFTRQRAIETIQAARSRALATAE